MMSDFPHSGESELRLPKPGLPTGGSRGSSQLLAVTLALALLAWHATEAADITVTTTLDEFSGNGDCSLREAILAANLDKAVNSCESGSGADSISLAPGTYVLSIPGSNEDGNMTGDLDITGDLKILGAGAGQTIIDGHGLDRIFEVLSDVTVTIADLTLQHGNPGESRGGAIHNVAGTLKLRNSRVNGSTARNGGGIANESSLLLDHSVLSSNMAFELGGGILNEGLLTLHDATLEKNESRSGGGLANLGTTVGNSVTWNANTAGEGGAIANVGQSSLSLTNCTISGNNASQGGGLFNSGVSNLRNCTLAHNSAEQGGGIFRIGGLVKLSSTLLGDNSKPSGAADDCAGALKSQGYNLIRTTANCEIHGLSYDLLGIDPELEPLTGNGGITRTHALKRRSPAIDAGSPLAFAGNAESSCPTRDQRGRARPLAGDKDHPARCDIGAFEFDPATDDEAD